MATSFCPQCGNQRQGSLRFCATCGFDFWKAASESPLPPVATSATPAQTTMTSPSQGPGRRRLALIAAGVILLVGAAVVIAANLTSKAPGVGSTASQSPTPTHGPTLPTCTSDQHMELISGKWTCITTEATPTLPAGPLTVALGQTVPIECGGDPCMDVTVAKVAFATRYRDPEGYYDDTPRTSGYVYMAVYVTYKATGPNADYNEFDWAIYIDDVAGQSSTYVSNGPTPELQSGQLPDGKSAVGWIVYEVPAKGRITISYQPGRTSIFEVQLRAS
jgi:hypothetical protein